MKNNLSSIAFSFLIVLTTGKEVLASAGGNSGGGGSGTASTPQEVIRAIETSPAYIRSFIKSVSLYPEFLNPCGIKNSETRKAVSEILGLDIANGICDQSTIALSEKAELALKSPVGYQCVKKHKDGFSPFQIGKPIQFCVKELRRYPKHALQKEISAIYLHEITHQLGYRDPTGKHVQDYFLEKLELYRAFSQSRNLIKSIEYWKERSELSPPIPLICSDLGALIGGLEDMSLYFHFNPDEASNTMKICALSTNKNEVLNSVEGYTEKILIQLEYPRRTQTN